MRVFALLIAAALLTTSVAFAQSSPAQSGPQNPAIKSTDQNNASQPVAGANSFTKSQARSRLMAHGYTHVSDLQKDSSGVWRGTASKDGHSGPVSVDYQGNIN
jgi:hypothetical protein